MGLKTFAFGLALMLAAATGRAETVTVFAAASLKEVLEEAASAFKAATGHEVRLSLAASSALARQIENGAPADLFISADTDWIDHIETRGLAVPGSRRNLAVNELVLVAPATSTISLKLAPGADLLAAIGNKRIALANPEAVPAGKYAKAALVKLGLWGSIESRVAGAENVRAALALVARGEAPLGIVYRTDALAERSVRIVDAFPAGTHAPIVYPLVVLKRAKGGAPAALAAWLGAPEGRAAFTRRGFRQP